jgi:hypothetical protein
MVNNEWSMAAPPHSQFIINHSLLIIVPEFYQANKKGDRIYTLSPFSAPQVGLEPTTLRLTAACSAIELLRITATGILPNPSTVSRANSKVQNCKVAELQSCKVQCHSATLQPLTGGFS